MNEKKKPETLTEDQKRVILTEYGRTPAIELAAKINRSIDCLYWWASQLGCTKRPKLKVEKPKGPRKPRSMWTRSQIQSLLDNYGRMDDEQLAQRVDKAVVTIHARYKQLMEQNMSLRLEEKAKREAAAHETRRMRQIIDDWVPLKLQDDDQFIRHHHRL